MGKAPQPIKELLSAYDDAYKKRFAAPAPFVHGKDAKLAKQLLARYELPDLRHWIDVFFRLRDPFIQQSGYTFGVFASCLGKAIVASRANPRMTLATEADLKQFKEDMQQKRAARAAIKSVADDSCAHNGAGKPGNGSGRAWSVSGRSSKRKSEEARRIGS